MSKVMSVTEAANLVNDNNTIWAVCSGGGINEPGLVLDAIEKRFLQEGHPRNLNLCHTSGIGDGKGGGAEHFAHEGMVKRVIGSHWSWAPKLSHMVKDNKLEGYVLPQGVMAQLLRAIAGKKPGVISHVGLGTFVDPRYDGGALNQRSQANLVEVMEVSGSEWLFYKSFPIDVVIIRGTTADEDGNISMEHEGVYMEALPAAQAAKNCGGIVIAQVKRVAQKGTLDPRIVKVPGILVDAVVVDPEQTQSMAVNYNPAYSGEIKTSFNKSSSMPFNIRKIVARRAAMELFPKAVVNLGFGMSDGVASIALEEEIFDKVTFTVEQGVIGGIPALGVNFSLGTNPTAIIEHHSQFDWYDGGGLDLSFLAFAQVDFSGNVNVSKFGNRIVGVGGFINISQNAKKVVFCGSFSTSDLEVKAEAGELKILKEGKYRKLCSTVEQISFNSKYAKEKNQEVLFVTERAVFSLGKEGLILKEIAPGVDLEKDILDKMDFKPIISHKLKKMDSRIFKESLMGIKNEM
ncbi:acyl CoA:acetate/3-ketoacid CoA transferase [Halocella sp. SP3-1]|nr:acyl CoA:acetate/3-ketoacid CoA transferase [Halocella sp. SP3-1]